MEKTRSDLTLVLVLLGGGFLMLFGFIFVLMLALVGFESDFKIGKSQGVGVLEINGVIEDSMEWLEDLADFEADKSVKALVIRINSPGGAVAPSQEIYREIHRLREVMPVVASMSTVAASGGYYIACAAERVFASPGTITGSIGVIIQTTYMKELMDFLKMEPVIYKSGEHKDILSPFRHATEEENVLINEMVQNVYDQFLTAVAESRNIDKEALRKIADGRVLSGQQALEASLVDEMGNFYDAVAYAGEKAGLGPDPELIYPKKDSLSYLEELLDSVASGFARATTGKTSGVEYRLAP